MKIVSLVIAALAGTAALVPVAAQAQHTVVHERNVVREHGRSHHQVRRVCRNDVRHGHRVQVCRTVHR